MHFAPIYVSCFRVDGMRKQRGTKSLRHEPLLVLPPPKNDPPPVQDDHSHLKTASNSHPQLSVLFRLAPFATLPLRDPYTMPNATTPSSRYSWYMEHPGSVHGEIYTRPDSDGLTPAEQISTR